MSKARDEKTIDKYFKKWFKNNEKRFHHGQFTDEQMCYSSFINGYNYNSYMVSKLEQEKAELLGFISEIIIMLDTYQTESELNEWKKQAVKILQKYSEEKDEFTWDA